MKYQTYLAFPNAIESSKYYIDNFGATFTGHLPLTQEIVDQVGLTVDDLSKTTFTAILNVFGVEFPVSDRLGTGEFSDSIDLLINYGKNEHDDFMKTVEICKKADVTLLYDSTETDEEYIMYRFQDKFGLIWSVMHLKDKEL